MARRAELANLYLDLLERVLTRAAFLDEEVRDVRPTGWKRWVQAYFERRGYRIVIASDPSLRRDGRDWPPNAETMIGLERLRNIRTCLETVLADRVPGDVLEAGVWRGGATIYAKAVLVAHNANDRTVWLADSFQGLPPPRLPQDAGLNFDKHAILSVGAAQVRANFERYGLLDDRVQLLQGWFANTLPGPVKQLAILRVDGDLYESTRDALSACEPLVAPGGFVIVDDYGDLDACRQAVHDYRSMHGITASIEKIDWTGIFWRKSE